MSPHAFSQTQPIPRPHHEHKKTVAMSDSMHSNVTFSPWLANVTKRDKIARMIGKTRATQKLTRSEKKRLALSIMSSPLQKMSLGAKQYAMAVALNEAQKKVKVQPIGFFAMNDAGDEANDEFPVRRIHWGTVETKLISYDIPFEVTGDKENERNVTTERAIKIDQMIDVYKNVQSNLREYRVEKKGIDAVSTA